jgi:PIN domain nuclease of toxin-antitoxin system
MDFEQVILLDTHVLLWLALEPNKLSRAAARSIRQATRGGGLAVASITLLELAWLFANGRVRSGSTVHQALARIIDATGVTTLDLTPEIAATAVQLPDSMPADPADRLIVATALTHAMPLVTRDARVQDARLCKVVW